MSARLLFVDHVSRIFGGAELNLAELAAANRDAGFWEIIGACPLGSPLAEALQNAGAPLCEYRLGEPLNRLRFAERRLGWRHARSWLAMRRAQNDLQKIIARLAPQTVVSCANKDHFIASAACRRAGVPSVWWVNDVLSPDFFSWPVRRAFRQAARRAARVVAVSRFAANALRNLGLPEERVVAIPNGIPLEKYSPRPRGRLRKLLEISADQFLVGIVGRFAPWKGQEFFLDLAERWIAAGRPGHFALVGQAFNEDAAFERRLRERTLAPPLLGRAALLPFQQETAAALSDLDVLTHASLRPEPFGRVIIEAMAAGAPALAARAGGVLEIVEDEVNGLLASPGDPESYLRQLERLYSSPALREKLAGAAQETVRRNFAITRVLEQFRHCLASVADPRREIQGTST